VSVGLELETSRDHSQLSGVHFEKAPLVEETLSEEQSFEPWDPRGSSTAAEHGLSVRQSPVGDYEDGEDEDDERDYEQEGDEEAEDEAGQGLEVQAGERRKSAREPTEASPPLVPGRSASEEEEASAHGAYGFAPSGEPVSPLGYGDATGDDDPEEGYYESDAGPAKAGAAEDQQDAHGATAWDPTAAGTHVGGDRAEGLLEEEGGEGEDEDGVGGDEEGFLDDIEGEDFSEGPYLDDEESQIALSTVDEGDEDYSRGSFDSKEPHGSRGSSSSSAHALGAETRPPGRSGARAPAGQRPEDVGSGDSGEAGAWGSEDEAGSVGNNDGGGGLDGEQLADEDAVVAADQMVDFLAHAGLESYAEVFMHFGFASVEDLLNPDLVRWRATSGRCLCACVFLCGLRSWQMQKLIFEVYASVLVYIHAVSVLVARCGTRTW
jgi:hypothetical protein